jgi:hypothetical protein
MANEVIQHGSTIIVDASAVIQTAALPDSGVTAATYTASTTAVPTIAVNAKGLVTSVSSVAVKMTGVDFIVAGNTLIDQTIFANTSAPSASDGANGDVWYQTIS